jgi:hypothetical protein
MSLTAFLVIVGNAAAAGPVGRPLLSSFYTTFNHIVPQGSGVSLLRGVEYFDGHGATLPLVTLAVWAAAGCVLALLGTVVRLPQVRDSAQRFVERFASAPVLNYRSRRDGSRSERAVLPARVLSPAD